MRIYFEKECREVTDVHEYGSLSMIELDDGTEWYIAPTREVAGEAARGYWEDMANSDPEEFTCMVGQDALIAWCLGQSAGPGSTKVTSLEEWLDLHLDVPEEHFASYDGQEVEGARLSRSLQEELGGEFTSMVDEGWAYITLYRHN